MYDITPFELDEQRDLEHYDVWLLDGTHSIPPMTPLSGWAWVQYCRSGMQYGAEMLSLPTCKGWDWRLHDHCIYLTPLVVTSEEEVKQREQVFRQRIAPIIEDYDKVWQGYVKEMLAMYDHAKSLDLGKASNIELMEHFEELMHINKRVWDIHMFMMYAVDGVFILFENICKTLLGIDDTNPTFHKLVRGFDNEIFQADRKLWQLSKRAIELGIADVFQSSKPNEVLPKLEGSEAGRKWSKELYAFIDQFGWRTARIFEYAEPSWVEDPSPAIMNVKQYLAKGGDFNLDDERKVLAEEREAAEKDVLSRVSEEQKGWFTALLRLAQRSSAFSEEHNLYIDLYATAVIRRGLLAIGNRLAAAGTIGHRDDIFFLIPDEIRRVCIDPANHDLRPLVARRRENWAGSLKREHPPLIGKIGFEEAVGLLVRSVDPIALKIVVGSLPVPRPELKADLYGTCGSPGIAEGRARVVYVYEDLINVQEGEILVAPATYVSWTPIFSLIKGVVVDRGASLSHAAIVGREYGIPVVMNVFTGTSAIKNGQTIRVDGNLGTVHILG